MGPVIAPAGTVAVMLVAVLVVATPGIPLKSSIFFDAVVLKLVPVIVITSPGTPVMGEMAVIEG